MIKLVRHLDTLVLKDGSWVTLGQLRELVAEADRLEWVDSSLICSIGETGQHPSRSDLRTIRGLAIEGGPK